MSLNKTVLLTKPVLEHFGRGNHPDENIKLILLQRSTAEAHAMTTTAIVEKPGVGFHVNTAVQYAFGEKWYRKAPRQADTLGEALKIAYGEIRKHYKVTASRSLAGLLHDSVVPATDDIDF